MADERTKRSAVTVALLVLACCRLALPLSMLSPSSSIVHDGNPAAHRVEPVGYLASLASSVLAAHVAATASASSTRRDGRRIPAGALLAEARRMCARPTASALYVELLKAAMASLLLTLGALLSAIGGGGNAAAGLLAASGSAALVAWLIPVLFAHLDIACRMSLVVAAEEEGVTVVDT